VTIAIHNESVKLLAAALNNLGVGAIIAGTIAPTIAGAHNDAGHVLTWLVFGVDLIGFAQIYLRRLQ
jgi:hypothetical protein